MGVINFELTNGGDSRAHPLIEMLTHLKIWISTSEYMNDLYKS